MTDLYHHNGMLQLTVLDTVIETPVSEDDVLELYMQVFWSDCDMSPRALAYMQHCVDRHHCEPAETTKHDWRILWEVWDERGGFMPYPRQNAALTRLEAAGLVASWEEHCGVTPEGIATLRANAHGYTWKLP